MFEEFSKFNFKRFKDIRIIYFVLLKKVRSYMLLLFILNYRPYFTDDYKIFNFKKIYKSLFI